MIREILHQFPQLADPWLMFLLKIAGIIAVLAVPLAQGYAEYRAQRDRAEALRIERERVQAEARQAMPAHLLSPIMSGLSDRLTADELRTAMSVLSGEIAALTLLVREWLNQSRPS